MTAREGPLTGLVVLDFSRMVAGPYASAMLADMGATIVKVESPHGDDQRFVGATRQGRSVNFEILNRGKLSMVLDLRTDEGRALGLRLAERADVVMENFRPGVAERLGIGYAAVRALNPDVVYCSVSGFGQHGPLSAAPSYDVIAQALSGIMDLTGSESSGPTLVGDSIGDVVAGIYAALGIAVALVRRGADGLGSHVDIGMMDALFSLLPTALAQWQTTGSASRSGNHHPLSAPFGAFQARDRPFCVAVANDKLFTSLCAVVGRPEAARDPRFATDQLRRTHLAEITDLVQDWSQTLDADDAVSHLAAAGVPAAPIWDFGTAASSAQVAARGLVHESAHPDLGVLWIPEQPVHFGIDRGPSSPAPALGADAAEVCERVLGMSPREVAQLREAGVV